MMIEFYKYLNGLSAPITKEVFTKRTFKYNLRSCRLTRGGSRTAATSKMERFVIIVNGLKPLTVITKRSILDVAAVLDPPLLTLLPNPKT